MSTRTHVDRHSLVVQIVLSFLALILLTTTAVGAQIGSASTTHFSGPRIRLLFSILPLIGALLVIARLVR